MKKLFALAIVAGMAFVSCNNAPKNNEEINDQEEVGTEVTITEDQDEDMAVMAEENEAAEEEAAE